MPAYRSRSVFQIKNLKAFLNLETGLTRGEVPDPERQLRQAQVHVEHQNHELEQLRPGRKQQTPPGTGSFVQDESYRPPNILHIALDDGGSGAGRAAYKLHAGLRRLGHESSMFVSRKISDDPTVQAFEPPADQQSRQEREERRRRIKKDFELYGGSRPPYLIGDGFTDDRSANGPELLEQLPSCDLINLHWFGNFLDYQTFFTTIPEETPVVWTLHDMNAFTGGCHYDNYCGKFAYSCGACPQLGSDNDEDLSRQVWARKNEAFGRVEDDRLQLVAVSHWLAEEAGRSSLLGGFPITTINPSLDSQVFAPRDRAAARSALGVPEDAAVVLFIADSLITRRKGFPLLAEALESLQDVPNLFLLSLGHHDPGTIKNVPHLNLGYVEDDLALSGVYSAANVFVMPSLQEAFGQTVLEAMSCGTPVVGFDLGGIPDMIRPGITGELVPPKDPEALGKAIRGLLEDPERRATLSANGRRMVVEEFAQDVQAGRYAELYRSMLGARAGRRAG